MKLQGNIIVTFPDFIKHFECGEFWQNKDVFVRDMHPDRIYYWDSKDILIYEKIAQWLKDYNNMEKQKDGLSALSSWIGMPITMSMLAPEVEGNVSLKEQIVFLESGVDYVLPKFNEKTIGQSAFTIALHKLEFCGESNIPIKVGLGDVAHYYYAGDVAYVTAINGTCVEILNNSKVNDLFSIKLINQQKTFGSKLLIRNIASGDLQALNDVTSFAPYESGVIYIRGGEIKFHGIANDMLLTFFKLSPKPIYVKQTSNNAVVVLYTNGEIKTTGYEVEQNFYGTAIDNFGNILNV